MDRRRVRWLWVTIATLAVGLLGAPGLAVHAAAPLVVAWIPDSPLTVYADGPYGALARPTYRVHNGTDEQLMLTVTLHLDPPEIVGPGDAPFAGCSISWPMPGESATETCSIPIRADQVDEGVAIRATLEVSATMADGTELRASSEVLEIVGVASPASLVVTIDDPTPPVVVVMPGELTVGFEVANDGQVAFDMVSSEVRVETSGAAGTPRDPACPTELGPLAIGERRAGTCTIPFTDDAPGRASLLVVAQGTFGDASSVASERLDLSLVSTGARLAVELDEVGLADGPPAPGQTFALDIYLVNHGSVPLDVTTSTHPTVPDCARHVEGVAAAEERVIRCDFLIPPDETACLMPYVVEATGTSAEGTVVGARAESRVSLAQDAPCGPDPGPASTDIALPATDLGVKPGSRAVAGPDWIALSAVVVVGIAACAIALLGRRRRPG